MMQWEFVVALLIVIPVIVLPAALVWYLNVGGIYRAIQAARKRGRATHEETTKAVPG